MKVPCLTRCSRTNDHELNAWLSFFSAYSIAGIRTQILVVKKVSLVTLQCDELKCIVGNNY